MTRHRAPDCEDDGDEDAAELSGWGNADFDAVILAPDATKQQQSLPTKFAAATARKREQRWQRSEKGKRESAQEQAQDVVALFRNNNNRSNSLFDKNGDNTDPQMRTNLRRDKLPGAQVSPTSHKSTTHQHHYSNNDSSKPTLPPKEFAVSGCAVPTLNFVRVTKVRSPAKRKQQQLTQQQQQLQQQLANLNPAQVLCRIVGLIDDHDDDAASDQQQPWRPTPLAVRKPDRNARFPPLLSSSTSVDALLSQHFRSDLEEKLRALPVPFGAHPIGQSASNATATVSTSLLPPLVDSNASYRSNGNNRVHEHISSRRRRNGGRKPTLHHRNQQQQQQHSRGVDIEKLMSAAWAT